MVRFRRRRTLGPSKPGTPFGSSPEEAAVLADLRRTIRRYGWAIIAIPDEGSESVGFQFTVGLTERGLPEVIVYGLGAEVGHYSLNVLAERLAEGERFTDGQVISGLVEGDYRFQLWDATRLRDPLGLASFMYGDDLSVRQLVVPDLDDRLPWELGYERPDLQPLLFDKPV